MPTALPDTSAARLRVEHLNGVGDARAAFAADVRRGLTSAPKKLFPKYFYDQLGSHLFDAICLLPEYYLTRAEDEILSRRADEIVADASAAMRGPVTLVEFGSGSAAKTRQLIEALLRRQRSLTYVPVDISTDALEASADSLLADYGSLTVEAYAGDYETALARLAAGRATRGPVLALFLGSNVGNFDRADAEGFLRGVRGVLSDGDALLLGADLKKDARVLEAAYDDALGVTAAFNLNLLARINRDLAADFDVRSFRHLAVYNAPAGRVEMHLESRREQRVRVGALALEINFAAGERIHTENSYKYGLDELSALAAGAGFARERTWLDEAGRFSSNLLRAGKSRGER